MGLPLICNGYDERVERSEKGRAWTGILLLGWSKEHTFFLVDFVIPQRLIDVVGCRVRYVCKEITGSILFLHNLLGQHRGHASAISFTAIFRWGIDPRYRCGVP